MSSKMKQFETMKALFRVARVTEEQLPGTAQADEAANVAVDAAAAMGWDWEQDDEAVAYLNKATALECIRYTEKRAIAFIRAVLEDRYHPLVEDEIQQALVAARDEFWAVIARMFPDATTGDLDADVSFAFERSTENAVRNWIAWNVDKA